MGAAVGESAFGTVFNWDTVDIAELTAISGPNMSVDTIDLTHHTSPNTFREFVAGLRDGGEVSIEGNFYSGDTAGQVALVTDMQAGSKKEAIITGPTSAAYTWTFDAICTSFELTHPDDDKIGFSATFKISGKPVLAVTVSANSSALSFIDSVGAKTPIPAYAAGTYVYSLTIASASGWIKVTTTHATAASIIAEALGVKHVLATTVQSEQIAMSAADSVTVLTIKYTVAGQITKTYTIYIQRP